MRKIVLFCAIMLVGLGMLTGIWAYKNKYLSEDGVSIVIYKHGKEMPIDPNTPHFKELQEKCEEFLSSVNNTLKDYVKETEVIAIKKNELAIEVVYKKSKEIEIFSFGKKEKRDHLLIPLTGKYVSIERKLRTTIFSYGPGYSVHYIGPYITPRSVTEILDLLKSMGIDIN